MKSLSTALDLQTEMIISEFQGSWEKAEAFASDALRFHAASKRSRDDLKGRSVFRLFIGKFTGANNRLRDISGEYLEKSLEATHKVMEYLGENMKLLSDSLMVTQSALDGLIREHDEFACRVVTLFEKNHERLQNLECNVRGNAELLEKLGVVVSELSETSRVLMWQAALPAALKRRGTTPCLVNLLFMATDFIAAKPRFWRQQELDVFSCGLLPPYFPQTQAAIGFFDDVVSLSPKEIEEVKKLFGVFTDGFVIDKPFHLFSGITWPVAMLWEVIHNRKSFSDGLALKKRLEEVHSFNIGDELAFRDIGIELLHGLKYLNQKQRVAELMVDLMQDARMEFADRLSATNVLLGDNRKFHALDYTRCDELVDWGSETYGFRAVLIETQGTKVTLHQQYSTINGESRWRILLDFCGSYSRIMENVLRRAEDNDIGISNYSDGERFQISREFEPQWARWDSQRQDLGQRQDLASHAYRMYEFFAMLPLPPR